MNISPSRLLAVLLLSSAFGAASAAPVTPTYDTFGNLAGATFGGSGIPTNPTAITTRGSLTLGLTATQRFGAPVVTNNGAGTFTGAPGVDGGRSLWNFDFYIADNGRTGLSGNGLHYKLLYDFNAGFGTDEADLGVIDIATPTSDAAIQNSFNLTFAFLSNPLLVSQVPTGGPYNPFAPGEYSFVLAAFNGDNVEIGRSAILVDVPEPASFALFGLAMFGMVGARRMRRK